MKRKIKKTQSYRENGDLIGLQADKGGFINCSNCKRKIKKELSYYYHPNCYCRNCWIPIDKQHKKEIEKILGYI
ncbi:hypothetical protein J4221_01250 [Candidatus Pacearchaeota archaeon]|nr:hypothetical protein [Candidatus Pacearchaeota archaeon]